MSIISSWELFILVFVLIRFLVSFRSFAYFLLLSLIWSCIIRFLIVCLSSSWFSHSSPSIFHIFQIHFLLFCGYFSQFNYILFQSLMSVRLVLYSVVLLHSAVHLLFHFRVVFASVVLNSYMPYTFEIHIQYEKSVCLSVNLKKLFFIISITVY